MRHLCFLLVLILITHGKCLDQTLEESENSSNESFIKISFSNLKEFKKKTNDLKILRLKGPPTSIDQPVNIVKINFKPLRILSVDPDKEVMCLCK